jgi:hypothetical protein
MSVRACVNARMAVCRSLAPTFTKPDSSIAFDAPHDSTCSKARQTSRRRRRVLHDHRPRRLAHRLRYDCERRSAHENRADCKPCDRATSLPRFTPLQIQFRLQPRADSAEQYRTRSRARLRVFPRQTGIVTPKDCVRAPHFGIGDCPLFFACRNLVGDLSQFDAAGFAGETGRLFRSSTMPSILRTSA